MQADAQYLVVKNIRFFFSKAKLMTQLLFIIKLKNQSILVNLLYVMPSRSTVSSHIERGRAHIFSGSVRLRYITVSSSVSLFFAMHTIS